ncbi:hypothetical protein HYW68_02035 [Candidatus Parcubacteria bacterium]|nr:hypothetical protein [Candidatus Parcubacteria bacterium]
MRGVIIEVASADDPDEIEQAGDNSPVRILRGLLSQYRSDGDTRRLIKGQIEAFGGVLPSRNDNKGDEA